MTQDFKNLTLNFFSPHLVCWFVKLQLSKSICMAPQEVDFTFFSMQSWTWAEVILVLGWKQRGESHVKSNGKIISLFFTKST